VERWREAHDRAVEAGEEGYVDPSTGFFVFTELGLLARGRCCGSGCRHCPYDGGAGDAVTSSPARR
jgi:hypothetical protein